MNPSCCMTPRECTDVITRESVIRALRKANCICMYTWTSEYQTAQQSFHQILQPKSIGILFVSMYCYNLCHLDTYVPRCEFQFTFIFYAFWERISTGRQGFVICWHFLSISDDLWENEIHLVHLKHEKERCGWENSPNLFFIRQYIVSNVSVSVISGPW